MMLEDFCYQTPSVVILVFRPVNPEVVFLCVVSNFNVFVLMLDLPLQTKTNERDFTLKIESTCVLLENMYFFFQLKNIFSFNFFLLLLKFSIEESDLPSDAILTMQIRCSIVLARLFHATVQMNALYLLYYNKPQVNLIYM
jgi:hypothetical protein